MRHQSILVPDYDNQAAGILGMLAFGCIVALAAAVGVGFGLWILASKVLDAITRASG